MADNSANSIDLDSLPYVDRELDIAGMKDKVNLLIEQEMRKISKKDRVQFPKDVKLFANDEILSSEWARTNKQLSMATLDLSRYDVAPPAAKDKKSVEAWESAIDNSKAQLEAQTLRLFNLELLQKYGANAWKVHNFQLEAYLKQLKSDVEDKKKQILDLNKQRKFEQTEGGSSLRDLESKWSDLISQTLQVEVACASLENELEELKRYENGISSNQ
ncbi:Pre-mRNA-splicing factor SPF27 [Umbelopsis sp. AD052]|nr:Pre-mRNA-splicing factor SPF27 [Umbelopsis sp. AD052]